MKSLVILFFLILSSTEASARTKVCLLGDVNTMTWTQKFGVYSEIMKIENEEQHQSCLLDFFYRIRQNFIIETLKGEENYKAFFTQVQQHFAIENTKPIKLVKTIEDLETTEAITVESWHGRNHADPKYFENLVKLNQVAPLMLFFQQVWMEQALDRWLERKSKSAMSNTMVAGSGVVVLAVGMFAFPPTRKVTHRTLKVLLRIFHETSKSKLAAFLIVPSAAISQSTEGDAIAKYKKLKAQYQLPLSPFELTEEWLNTKQNDLMDTETDQFWSDLASISSSAATGTVVGLLAKKLLTLAKVKNKILALGATVAVTVVTTNTMEKAMAETLYLRDYEKVVRKLNEALYDVDADLKAHKKSKAYLDMYGLVNEMEIYSLLKIRDAGLKISEYEKKAIRSCWPAWSDEEIKVKAKLLQHDLKEQFRLARNLIKDFRSGSSALVHETFPYFSERLNKIKRFIDIMTSENELESTLRNVIIEKNECYKP